MQITVLCVGKIKGTFSYLEPGIVDYLKRLQPYVKTVVVEVADEAISPSKTREQILEKEAHRILPHIERADLAVAMTEFGERLTSEQFAHALAERLSSDGFAANPSNGGMRSAGGNSIIFIVGGALGLCESVLARCRWRLSLSPMTFPHQMVRLFLLEQLYRAFKIQRNEPYHK